MYLTLNGHFLKTWVFPISGLFLCFFAEGIVAVEWMLHVLCALCRRLWRGPHDDFAGVDARAAYVRGRGVNALHPRGPQLRPPDGHGDRSVWVAHGQRQPAHLAIGRCTILINMVQCHLIKTWLWDSEEVLVPEVVQNNVTKGVGESGATDTLRLSPGGTTN